MSVGLIKFQEGEDFRLILFATESLEGYLANKRHSVPVNICWKKTVKSQDFLKLLDNFKNCDCMCSIGKGKLFAILVISY